MTFTRFKITVEQFQTRKYEDFRCTHITCREDSEFSEALTSVLSAIGNRPDWKILEALAIALARFDPDLWCDNNDPKANEMIDAAKSFCAEKRLTIESLAIENR